MSKKIKKMATSLLAFALIVAAATLVIPNSVQSAVDPSVSALSVSVPFNSNSIWNRPIGSNPAIRSNSSQMIQLLVSDPNRVPIILPGVDQYWSIPVYEADSSTPRYRICYPDGSYCADNVPVPNNTLADPTYDGKAVVLDITVSPAKAWSFWRLGWSGSGWTAEADGWGDISTTGDGIHNFDGGSWGGRATGWNYYAGLITPEEIRQGHIDHALVMSIPGEVCSTYFEWPARGGDGYSSSPNAIPEGARLQLDPSINVDSLPLSEGGKIIARALQTYGTWLGDTGGATAIYAQEFLYLDSSGQVRRDGSPWQGLLDGTDLYNFPTDRLRVVEVNQADFYENASKPSSAPAPTPTHTATSTPKPAATPTPTSTPKPAPTSTPTPIPSGPALTPSPTPARSPSYRGGRPERIHPVHPIHPHESDEFNY